jgi:molybdate transport system ATP-binding protein
MVNTSPQPRTINLNYNANNSVACSEPIIEIKNTTIQYDNKKILDNINWTVNSGEKWLIKGHNGAGKSTLLSLITGDNPQAYANNVKLFGKQRGTGESIWELKKKIGFLSPELHKYFDAALTVEDTIKSGFFDTMGVYKKLNQAQIEIANHIFEQFQLHPYTHQPFGTLSIGLQRWTLLARALIKNPPLLILDEPCQGLDENHIMQLLHTINYYVATYHTTLLYVTHIENEIPEHMDYLLQLDRGRQQIIKIKNNNIENTDEVQTTEFKNFEKV